MSTFFGSAIFSGLLAGALALYLGAHPAGAAMVAAVVGYLFSEIAKWAEDTIKARKEKASYEAQTKVATEEEPKRLMDMRPPGPLRGSTPKKSGPDPK